MNTEVMSDLGRRAAMHAVLADPARLAITDTLADGDASPSELAAMLATPSNLLAHHLRALEGAGMVTPHRSEGDRRRAYLPLVPGAPATSRTPGTTAPWPGRSPTGPTGTSPARPPCIGQSGTRPGPATRNASTRPWTSWTAASACSPPAWPPPDRPPGSAGARDAA